MRDYDVFEQFQTRSRSRWQHGMFSTFGIGNILKWIGIVIFCLILFSIIVLNATYGLEFYSTHPECMVTRCIFLVK